MWFHLLLALPLGGPSDPAALERALTSVRAENVRADIGFIASDELEGRDTPSHGLRLAARYLRARLERLGFQPAGDDGFFDRYQLERSGLDLEATQAWIARGGERTTLAFGADYGAFGASPHRLEGGVVFVGAGREEDLEGLDLHGRWALVADAGGRGRGGWEERARRQERLQAAGALGILSAPDLGQPEKALQEADERLARFASFASGRQLRLPGAGPRMSSGGVSLSLSSGAARTLLGDAAPEVGTELPLTFGDVVVDLPVERVDLENVAGLWPGSDPVLQHEVVILSAHYDHEGVRDGVVYNGADDNGSGTCGLLAVAEALKAYGPMRRSVLLLWVSGEEKGLLGSAAWVAEPTLPPDLKPVCDLNIDMIGRNAPDKLLITPSESHPERNGLARLAESMGALEGFPAMGSADEYWNRSDHANFAEGLKIPVAFLFSDVHEDYHQPTDDPEKIDCDKIRRVVRLVVRLLDALQEDTLAL